MADHEAVEVARREPEAALLRDHFLGWQCRLRQLAVRRFGGRPPQGMRPQVLSPDGQEIAAAITVLLLHRHPAEATAEFRHIVRRTQDPRERYAAGLKHLAAAHYQYPRDFSDVMTALFAAQSPVAAALIAAGRCVLDFREGSQSYRIPCAVGGLDSAEPAWQATYWHNAMFNPHLPGEVAVLDFAPDWTAAEADPPVLKTGK